MMLFPEILTQTIMLNKEFDMEKVKTDKTEKLPESSTSGEGMSPKREEDF